MNLTPDRYQRHVNLPQFVGKTLNQLILWVRSGSETVMGWNVVLHPSEMGYHELTRGSGATEQHIYLNIDAEGMITRAWTIAQLYPVYSCPQCQWNVGDPVVKRESDAERKEQLDEASIEGGITAMLYAIWSSTASNHTMVALMPNEDMIRAFQRWVQTQEQTRHMVRASVVALLSHNARVPAETDTPQQPAS